VLETYQRLSHFHQGPKDHRAQTWVEIIEGEMEWYRGPVNVLRGLINVGALQVFQTFLGSRTPIIPIPIVFSVFYFVGEF